MRAFVCAVVLALGSAWTAAAAELPRAAPEEVGFSAERLERVTEWMQSYVDDTKLAGAQALIIREGRIAYFESVGKSDIARDTPVSEDTIFRIYSMTKPVTAVAVMMLVEEGAIKLTDPVGEYLPDLKDRKVVEDGPLKEVDWWTVRHVYQPLARLLKSDNFDRAG
ncbi:MAG: serine hydrolase domain-containing protein, partial [Alphaproteobacteria bacterium]|nr:serine hydrolase domain-containing protein [Alphaproteobacteria bacterium]